MGDRDKIHCKNIIKKKKVKKAILEYLWLSERVEERLLKGILENSQVKKI